MSLPHQPHKTFKRSAPLARGGKLKRGKKTKAWEKVRRSLKLEFVGMGIQTCELRLPGCAFDNLLGFAHALKRRNIHTDQDMRRVILACNICHDILEVQGEAQMARIVDGIIAGRVS
jgi:hypothetical protein